MPADPRVLAHHSSQSGVGQLVGPVVPVLVSCEDLDTFATAIDRAFDGLQGDLARAGILAQGDTFSQLWAGSYADWKTWYTGTYSCHWYSDFPSLAQELEAYDVSIKSWQNRAAAQKQVSATVPAPEGPPAEPGWETSTKNFFSGTKTALEAVAILAVLGLGLWFFFPVLGKLRPHA